MASVELDRLRARWLKAGYTSEEISAEDPNAVANAIDTQSLFGDGRLVVIRGGARELDALTDRLAAWSESPPPGIAVVVVGAGAKLRKVLGARAESIEVPAPKPWQTGDWLVRHAKGLGRSMSADAAAALIDALGTDLRELATATEQLTMSTNGAITLDVVGRLFRGLESQLYQFLESMVQRDRPSALRHLNALLRSGMHPLQLMNGLGNQFRALAAAREAGRVPAAALAKELDLSAGYANRALKHARNFDAGEIRRAFRLLADADLALMGGERNEDQPPELVMELVVSEIAGERAVVPRR